MKCQKCSSERVANISGKTSDMCYVCIKEIESNGYVPCDMNIGGGDYIEFHFCLECGQIQGQWPLPKTELEEPPEDEEPT